MHTYWTFIKTPGFSKQVYEYYCQQLPVMGDIVCEVKATESVVVREGSLSIAVLFSDRSDLCDLLRHKLHDVLYGVIYDTGVLVSGARGPKQLPVCVETGMPAQGFEALVLPTTKRRLTQELWMPVLPQLWAGAEEALRYVYDNPNVNSGLHAGSFPDMKFRWEMVYVLPSENPEVVNDLLASVQSFELSKIAVLGSVPEGAMKELDNRFTLFMAPTVL